MSARRINATLGLAGLATVAVMGAVAAFGAMVAQAEGPVWHVPCHEVAAGLGNFKNSTCTEAETGGKFSETLVAGEKKAFTSTGGTFTLDGSLANIVCSSQAGTGELIGGDPGTDLAHIEFSGCAVQGKTVAECGASNTATAGLVESNVKTVLVWPDPTGPNDTEALDAFTPDNGESANNLFTEFTLKGTNCPFGLNNLKVNVNATGTLITKTKGEAIEKKCGVLGVLGKLNASSIFEKTTSGQLVRTGAINTEELLTEALWEKESGTLELITCKLEAFGAESSELGISEITLTEPIEFGWSLLV